tara:strand:+ start:89 stop:622 length:534 start_codon:yes stop_codon:yes gene_type:complete
MKKLSVFISLFLFSFATISNAENIKDFQIEGIAIGDNLLDYYSEKEIKELMKTNSRPVDGNRRFTEMILEDLNGQPLEQYEYLSLVFKNNDNNYHIHGIGGMISMQISDCKKAQQEISKQITEVFWKSKIVLDDWTKDAQGNKVHIIALEFENGYGTVACFIDPQWLQVYALLEELI